VVADFVLKEGEKASFVLRFLDPKAEHQRCPEPGEVEELFRATVEYWRRWLSHCTYHGRWRETVQRSALTLKLLSFEPTGAIVAAPTCSLPEAIGGVRNWDYRYTWIRETRDSHQLNWPRQRIDAMPAAIELMMRRLAFHGNMKPGPPYLLYQILA
jgi:GH15 family glucan-1,4-alpha-glucosidase